MIEVSVMVLRGGSFCGFDGFRGLSIYLSEFFANFVKNSICIWLTIHY